MRRRRGVARNRTFRELMVGVNQQYELVNGLRSSLLKGRTNSPLQEYKRAFLRIKVAPRLLVLFIEEWSDLFFMENLE